MGSLALRVGEVERAWSWGNRGELVSTVLAMSLSPFETDCKWQANDCGRSGPGTQFTNDTSKEPVSLAWFLPLYPFLSGAVQHTEWKCTLSSGIINSPLYSCCQKTTPLHFLVRHGLSCWDHYFLYCVLANRGSLENNSICLQTKNSQVFPPVLSAVWLDLSSS